MVCSHAAFSCLILSFWYKQLLPDCRWTFFLLPLYPLRIKYLSRKLCSKSRGSLWMTWMPLSLQPNTKEYLSFSHIWPWSLWKKHVYRNVSKTTPSEGDESITVYCIIAGLHYIYISTVDNLKTGAQIPSSAFNITYPSVIVESV